MEIIDISLSLTEETIVYPGDVKFEKSPICTIDKSGCNMTKLVLGTHTGTHIDAPLHFLKDRPSVDALPLNVFVGKTQVIEIKNNKITKQEIESRLLPDIKRVLFKTKNSWMWEKPKFSKEYIHLSEDGAEFLIENKILLVGIDYVSIERFGTPDFSVHKKLFSHNIPVLEGLNLKNVEPGLYFLIALPLKLKGLDGSPVRAVLIRGHIF